MAEESRYGIETDGALTVVSPSGEPLGRIDPLPEGARHPVRLSPDGTHAAFLRHVFAPGSEGPGRADPASPGTDRRVIADHEAWVADLSTGAAHRVLDGHVTAIAWRSGTELLAYRRVSLVTLRRDGSGLRVLRTSPGSDGEQRLQLNPSRTRLAYLLPKTGGCPVCWMDLETEEAIRSRFTTFRCGWTDDEHLVILAGAALHRIDVTTGEKTPFLTARALARAVGADVRPHGGEETVKLGLESSGPSVTVAVGRVFIPLSIVRQQPDATTAFVTMLCSVATDGSGARVEAEWDEHVVLTDVGGGAFAVRRGSWRDPAPLGLTDGAPPVLRDAEAAGHLQRVHLLR